jgi:hypothetical protein
VLSIRLANYLLLVTRMVSLGGYLVVRYPHTVHGQIFVYSLLACFPFESNRVLMYSNARILAHEEILAYFYSFVIFRHTARLLGQVFQPLLPLRREVSFDLKTSPRTLRQEVSHSH